VYSPCRVIVGGVVAFDNYIFRGEGFFQPSPHLFNAVSANTIILMVKYHDKYKTNKFWIDYMFYTFFCVAVFSYFVQQFKGRI